MATGKITPGEGAAMSNAITAYARTINMAEIEERLTKIEKQLQGNGK
jgi:hypothetical protein